MGTCAMTSKQVLCTSNNFVFRFVYFINKFSIARAVNLDSDKFVSGLYTFEPVSEPNPAEIFRNYFFLLHLSL